jgi:anaerobic selenocysteine-containing dehydrogenase
VFRELGARLELSEAGDDIGETGALIDALPRMPGPLAAALAEGQPAPAPGQGRPIQFVDVLPKTPDGIAHLYPATLAASGALYRYQPNPGTSAYPLALISPASEHTISSTLGELRPGVARVKIHPDDAAPRSISEGDTVRIFNALGEVHCEASVTPETRPGTLALPKGLWARSTLNGATATALAPDTLEELSGGACFNDARVQIELFARH